MAKHRSNIAMTPADEAMVFREIARRNRGEEASKVPVVRRVFAFLSTFFHAQAWFAADPAKRKAALCTRRAGKSNALAGILLEAALNEPYGVCIYIGLTRRQAKKIMWKELRRLNEKYSLGLKFSHTDLTATLRNGAEIRVCGATDSRDIDRIRGEPFLIAAIDEAGAFPEDLLEELINEVLEPATLDYDGQILLTGTPTAACSGLFYRATTGGEDKNGKATPFYFSRPPKGWKSGKPIRGIASEDQRVGWSVHRWTLHENPYIPKAGSRFKTSAEWLTWLRKERGYTEQDAFYLREYCGIWIRDTTMLVYPEINESSAIARDRKGTPLEGLPTGNYDWTYGISIDLGYDDPCAIAVFAWCPQLPEIYCAELTAKSGMVIAEIAAEVKAIRRRVRRLAFCVIDQGGGTGKMVSEEFRRIYQIDCEGAKKNEKETYLRFANSDFRTGRLKIIGPKCPGLFGQLKALQWDPKKPGTEDERFANDKADAFLYGHRKAHGLHHHDKSIEPEEVRPEAGSRAAQIRQEETIREKVEKKAAERKRQRAAVAKRWNWGR